LPGENEENHETPQVSRSQGRNFNPGLPNNNQDFKLLDHAVQYSDKEREISTAALTIILFKKIKSLYEYHTVNKQIISFVTALL